MMERNIAIIIPCFNRTETLKSLLNSLLKAKFTTIVELVFSIDYSGSDAVGNLVEGFEWPFGKKKIVRHEKNIGLRRNIISCGDMTDDYDAVIVLEDDLIVSPLFYDYAQMACDYYWDDEQIAGISLYNYRYSETLHEFYPITMGYDTYFMQWTSSWGQLWTKRQWRDFKNWYNKCQEDLSDFPIPVKVKRWRNSWKKFHIAYLCDRDKYFVYPSVSYTTIKPSPGTHSGANYRSRFSMPLCINKCGNFIFQPLKGAYKYDSFFELKDLNINLNGKRVNVDFDIFGDKYYGCLRNGHFVTSKRVKGKEIVKQWGMAELPYEMNIINDVNGEFFYLYNKKDYTPQNMSIHEKLNVKLPLSSSEMILYEIRRLIWKYLHR